MVVILKQGTSKDEIVKITKNIVDTCLSLFGCSKNSYFIKKNYIGFSKFGLTILLKDCKLMMNK